jgi:hypothetical protein
MQMPVLPLAATAFAMIALFQDDASKLNSQFSR